MAAETHCFDWADPLQLDAQLTDEERNKPLNQSNRVRAGLPTLVERLHDAGYYQGVTHKIHVAPNEKFPYAEFIKGNGQWLTIVGLCAIMDPPRPECVDAISTAKTAGIRVVMITGDHKDTALAIGEMLGLVDEKYSEALTGPELDDMNEMQLRHAVMNYNVFARASPQNKIQIVEALQAEKQVASMTGKSPLSITFVCLSRLASSAHTRPLSLQTR